MRSQPITATGVAAVLPTDAAIATLRPISGADVSLTHGFWADRAAANRERTIPAGFEQLRSVGTLHNFELAASSARDGYRALGVMFDGPFPFLDSDVYKWLEGAGWALGQGPDPAIRSMADEAIALVERAQRGDGYLNTFVQVLRPGSEYRDLQWGHELYCIGHLIQAAIAWHRALGDDRLLLVAERAVASVWGALGPGDDREGLDGHPGIEMALVELYRATGERRHLDLAATFIDRRGHGWLGPGRFGRAYWQDHLPVREAPAAVGHAVRQLYLDAGAVDVAVERGDDELLGAVLRRWHDTVAAKMYLTGAMGSRHKDEAFGDPFELPPDRAYAETCAAIASVMLAWRLLLATGEPACADVIERTVYNGILSSLSRDATEYFYVIPLQRRTSRTWAEPGEGRRASWYACACCPPNLMRLVGSWPQMLATTDDDGLRVHQYASGEIAAAGFRLAVDTAYPWDGTVSVTVLAAPDVESTLSFRVPDWCAVATVRDGATMAEVGRRDGALVRETRRWQAGDTVELTMEMPPRRTLPDPRIDAIRGCVALERGPIVHAIESADLPAGVELEEVVLPDQAPLATERIADPAAPVVVVADGRAGEMPVRLRAIPYFDWGNRDDGAMRVWIPRGGR
jgi:DUF1680 family protein